MADYLLTLEDAKNLTPQQLQAAIQGGLIDPALFKKSMMTQTPIVPDDGLAGRINAIDANANRSKQQQMASIKAEMEAEKAARFSKYMSQMTEPVRRHAGMLSDHFSEKTMKDILWNDPYNYWIR